MEKITEQTVYVKICDFCKSETCGSRYGGKCGGCGQDICFNCGFVKYDENLSFQLCCNNCRKILDIKISELVRAKICFEDSLASWYREFKKLCVLINQPGGI
jgi:hypothetical protein